MRWIPLLSVLVVALACSLGAESRAEPGTHEVTRRFTAQGGEFEFSRAGLRIVATTDGVTRETWIQSEGELRIDQELIRTEKQERKLLESFVREAEKMAGWIDDVGQNVSVQMDSTATQEAKQKAAKQITRTGKKLEKQNAKVAALALDLVKRIPELAFLTSLLGN